jgi:ADP-ribose pyrophosphatase
VSDDDRLTETVVGRRELFRGGYLRLEELAIRLPDGRPARREVVTVRDAVAVLPVDAGGRVHLVRQHRAAIGRTILEVPAGVIEPGEAPLEAARRECEEEIGLRPHRLVPLISYAHAEGYSTGFITLYVGLDLEPVESPGLDATEVVERVVLPFAELRDKVRSNEIVDSKTILTTLLWEQRLASGGAAP